MIGQTISQYKILEKLGEGGMGVVYKALDTKLNREVALKFLPPHVAQGGVERDRFLQEAQVAASINHPNICVIYEINDTAEQPYIAMEYVDGETIRDAIKKSRFTIDTAIEYAILIAEAFDEAHSKGIVHRDIKADNIMINSKKQIKVMDFGLAKLKGSMKLTRTSSTVGTLAYMAPEQMQGGDVDPRSDIFAFGVLFFEMLSGRLPFRGEHEPAMMYSILNEDPENLQNLVPEASAEISFLIRTALEKNPEDRYQKMSDIVRDLRRLKKQSSRVNRPAFSGEYQKFETGRLKSSGNQQYNEPVQSNKNLKMYTGIGAVIAILVILGMFFLPRSGSIPFSSTKINRITSNGNIVSAAISPDGRIVAYSQYEKGKYSLWIKQLATSSNIQIKPPQDNVMEFLVFSPDGNFIYFTMDDASTQLSFFKIPVLGGNTIKIVEDVRGSVTFSPDGKQIAFQRINSANGNYAVVIASIDGTQQKELFVRSGDSWVQNSPEWSPDGSLLAFSLAMWKEGFHSELVSVDVRTAALTNISKNHWGLISRMQWLSDGKGLVVEGSQLNSSITQLYLVQYPSGTLSKITNDLNTYVSSSITNNNKILCTVQSEQNMFLYYVSDGDAKKTKKISSVRDDGTNGLYVNDGDVVFYNSRQGGAEDIWSSSLNGENKKQITIDEFPESDIHGNSKTKTLLFTSPKSGLPNIWSISMDGLELKQLTKDAEDYNAQIDPNGKWIVFDSWLRGPNTLMKIPAAGGERIDLTKTYGFNPCIAQDGKFVVYTVDDEKQNKLSVAKISIDGGEPVVLFDLPNEVDMRGEVTMRPNSNDISYVITENGVSNVYIRSLNGGGQKKYTNFDEMLIMQYAWTSDGKSLVVSRGDLVSDVVIINDEQNKSAK